MEGINFNKLDMMTAQIVLITDESFENARNMKIHLGYIILIKDENGNANKIHYGSKTFKRVTRSILEAEIHALFLGYDQEFVIYDILKEVIGRSVALGAY